MSTLTLTTAAAVDLLLLVVAAVKMIRQYEQGVLFRLGRVLGVREPGLRVIIPLVDVLHRGETSDHGAVRRGLERGAAIGALRRYELHGQADSVFDRLSGGQQARFQVLLLELSGCTLLLLDEPTDNLDLESAEGLPVACIGRAGLGTGLVSLGGGTEQQVLAIERLRTSGVVRHVVVLRAEPDLKRGVDVWGPIGSAVGALEAIKRAFDPANILNAGRGPV